MTHLRRVVAVVLNQDQTQRRYHISNHLRKTRDWISGDIIYIYIYINVYMYIYICIQYSRIYQFTVYEFYLDPLGTLPSFLHGFPHSSGRFQIALPRCCAKRAGDRKSRPKTVARCGISVVPDTLKALEVWIWRYGCSCDIVC